MNPDWEQLEHEINAAISAFGTDLDAPLPPDVLSRTRMSTRIASNDAWLTEHAATPLPVDVAEHLRSRIARELRVPWSVRAWQKHGRALSALGAAAMIGICVGIVHLTTGLSPQAQRPDLLSEFVIAGTNVYEADPVAASLNEDLQELEQSIVQWPTEADRVEDGLQQLDDMIDTLQDETSS